MRKSARVVLASTLAYASLWSCSLSTPPASPTDRETLRRRAQVALLPLYERMGTPQAGEWLATQNEAGETFSEYRDQNAVRSQHRRVIYIQPVGVFSPDEDRVIDDVLAMMTIFFDRPVKRLPALPLNLDKIPEGGWRLNPDTREPQVRTVTLLDALVPLLRRDALALIAFTATDLWPGGEWHYVFGQASLDVPVGVWSLRRFGDASAHYDRVLERAIKLAVHETGHMLGLRHCTAFHCGMNGTMNLQETDGNPLPFCPYCEHKLWWALDIDLVRRYERLIVYAKEHHLNAAAQFWTKALGRVRAL